jgi:hypothetical protein
MRRFLSFGLDAVAFVGIIALGLFAGMFMTPKAHAHEPYTAWSQPDNGGSCCNGMDCKISRAYYNGVQWMAEFEGEFIPVPPQKVLDPAKVENPDGNAHLCAERFGGRVVVYCFRNPEVRM